MISDDDLFRLALFLGSCAMLLIVLYHFLEVNAKDDTVSRESSALSTGGDSKQILRDADPVAFAPAVGTTAGGKGKGVAR
jgi:oligosaccharyl transferase complex subunit OST4